MTIDTLPADSVRFKHVLAFEVSKVELVVQSLPSGDTSSIANDRASIRRLIKKEKTRNAKLGLGPLLVVCEATGTYDAHVLDCAHELDVAVHRAHGSRVRAYARFRGKQAKSDPIDVGVLARYGRDSDDLDLHVRPRPEQSRLRELMDRRTDIEGQLEAERARIEHVRETDIVRMIEQHLRFLEKQLAAIEAALDELVKSDAAFSKASQLMQSVVGIGRVTPMAVLAYLPEIGRVSRATIAALAGLAPYDNDSGKSRGQRHIFGGRMTVRNALYMPAVAAVRRNPHLKEMYERLRADGKSGKAAITAVMRKMLVILNAIMASGEPCKMPKAARQLKTSNAVSVESA